MGFGAIRVSGALSGGGKLDYDAVQNPRSALVGDLFLMLGRLRTPTSLGPAERSDLRRTSRRS